MMPLETGLYLRGTEMRNFMMALMALALVGCPQNTGQLGGDRDDDGGDTVEVPRLENDDDGDGYSDCQVDPETGSCLEDQFGNVVVLDCDDSTPWVGPAGAQNFSSDPDVVAAGFTHFVEICDGRDNDCSRLNGGDGVPGDELDLDEDGYLACEAYVETGLGFEGGSDCDDEEFWANPGLNENPSGENDGIDNNCDGDIDFGTTDSDGDGVIDLFDCAPFNPSIHPNADEIGSCDGEDTDCDGSVPADEWDTDNDGWFPCEGDCDDSDESRFPGAPEICDSIDQNCDESTTDGFEDFDGDNIPNCEDDDADGDGWTFFEGDCNDLDDLINPGLMETPDDGIDQDCSGTDAVTCFLDLDGDQFGGLIQAVNPNGSCAEAGFSLLSTDCNDSSANINPAATEVCDGFDNDCDTLEDEGFTNLDGDSAADCVDSNIDGDNYPNIIEQLLCPSGWELDSSLHPDTAEILGDGIDQDCNGTDAVLCLADVDGDNYGVISVTVVSVLGSCNVPGMTDLVNAGDCNDDTRLAFPGMTEGFACDGIDNDCNGIVDDGLTCSAPDADGDGSPDSVDCNNSNATIYPGAPEVPDNNLDEDCNGTDTVTCYVDGDGDNYPDTTVSSFLVPNGNCNAAGGISANYVGPTDCVDSVPSINPGAAQVCDGIDNNCSGSLPLNEQDLDSDQIMSCAGDCDDLDVTIYPGAFDVPLDGIDQNCDGGDAGVCYIDSDQDGYGTTPTGPMPAAGCSAFEATVAGDCDDLEASVNPGATSEGCDGMDTNCDSALGASEVDIDLDGYMVCDGDCDDFDAAVNPGQSEVPDNGIDDDCVGGDDVTITGDDDDSAGDDDDATGDDDDATGDDDDSALGDDDDSAAEPEPIEVTGPYTSVAWYASENPLNLLAYLTTGYVVHPTEPTRLAVYMSNVTSNSYVWDSVCQNAGFTGALASGVDYYHSYQSAWCNPQNPGNPTREQNQCLPSPPNTPGSGVWAMSVATCY